MPLREFLAGLAFFLPTIIGAGAAATITARRYYGHLRGVELALAFALWLTLALLAAHIVPLALGILTRGTVVVTALALVGLAALLPGRPGPAPEAPRPPIAPTRPLSGLLASGATAAVAIYELAGLRINAANPFTHIDVLSFHLPGVARWIQTGSLWQVDQLFPYNVTGNYPNNGDVLTLATVLPWHDAAFARFVQLPFLALTWLAVFALARELRASTASAALAASLVAALPATSVYVQDGLPDVILLFGFATGLVFLSRHRRTNRWSDLVLAGLGLGLAFGTKWYGLTIDVAVIAIWAVVTLVERRRLAEVARRGLALICLVLGAGGVWLIRNLVESGNPIFPQKVGFLGLTLFGGTHGTAVDRYGYTVLHYIGDGAALRDFVIPGLRAQLGIAGPILGLGAIAIIAAFASARWRRRGAAADDAGPARWTAAIAAIAILIAILWAIIPGSAPGLPGQPQVLITVRWLVPAPLVAAAAIAGAAASLGALAVAVDALLAIAVVDALRRDPSLPTTALLEAALVLVLAAAILALAVRLRPRLRSLRSGRRRLALALGSGAALVVAVGAARYDQVHFDRHSYASFDPTFAWIDRHAPSRSRVGLAGESSLTGLSPILPAFGPRLANRVDYVGPWIDGLLREYRRRGPFVRAVHRGRYDLLLVGRGLVPRRDPPVERWARAAGYRRIAASRRLTLYRRGGVG